MGRVGSGWGSTEGEKRGGKTCTHRGGVGAIAGCGTHRCGALRSTVTGHPEAALQLQVSAQGPGGHPGVSQRWEAEGGDTAQRVQPIQSAQRAPEICAL